MEDTTLEKIYESSLKFLAPLNLEETYSIIVEEAVKLVKGESGSIVLEKEGLLIRVYDSSPNLGNIIKIRKNGFTHRSFIKRKAFVVGEKEFRATHTEADVSGIKSGVFIPLSYKNKSIGVLVVRISQEEVFTKQQLNILKLLGSMATMAIRKAQLHDETQKALESRDLFFSMAAHELRTPITTIYGYAQLLTNKMAKRDSSEARWVHQLYTESYRLTLLVNDLLEINRIRTGRLQYVWKECLLEKVIERAIENFQLNYPTRIIKFENKLGGKEGMVIADSDRILQVLLNLLDNSAKFSPAEQPIKVTLGFISPTFVISVEDKGQGISKKDLPKIFEGFYQGSNHQMEGMGLGLYLVRNIVEEHRGSTQIRSILGRGTTVKIKLPKAKI